MERVEFDKKSIDKVIELIEEINNNLKELVAKNERIIQILLVEGGLVSSDFSITED